MARPKQVFVSHATADSGFVKKVVAVLLQHGIPFWYSRSHIRGAQQWHDEIGAALRRCDWFVLVLSPPAVASKWVKRELLYALQEDRYQDRIVPVVAKPCKYSRLSWTLASFQFVDFSKDFVRGSRELLNVWNIKYKAPGSPTPRSASGSKARGRAR